MPARQRVLVVDSDPDVIESLQNEFRMAGFELVGAVSWSQALDEVRKGGPAAIIGEPRLAIQSVDWICQQLRQTPAGTDLPVLLLTTASDPDHRVQALEAGADDVVGKPFNPREVYLRVRALVRTRQIPRPERVVVNVGLLRFDADAHRVTVSGRNVALTHTEFRLLGELARHVGHVCQRDSLLQKLWDAGANVDERAVDSHIRRMRRKLGTARSLVQTVRGFGYRLADPGMPLSPT